MEFTRLADVEVVETANYTDKVLIEQNGEIKRVPKTEVGGSGNSLIITISQEFLEGNTTTFNSNMSFDDAVAALNNMELTCSTLYVQSKIGLALVNAPCIDLHGQVGFPCLFMPQSDLELALYWTEYGLSIDEPLVS